MKFNVFLLFDLLTIFISLADVVTDVIVLYDFYIGNAMIFFWISLSVLILAHLSYCVLFVSVAYSDGYAYCCIWLLSPLFSWLIPYLLYFYESPYMCNAYSICCRNFFDCYDVPAGMRELASHMGDEEFDINFKALVKNKISCHAGFILETFVESFPQSIIQMIAILQLDTADNPSANIVMVISIFLSLLSIAFKSIMLLAVADFRTSMFNWSATVIDFFAVFVVIGWIFLPNTQHPYLLSVAELQYFVFILLVCTSLPFAATVVMFLLVNDRIEATEARRVNSYRYHCCAAFYWAKDCCIYLCSAILIALSAAIAHIVCWVFIALYLSKFGLGQKNDNKKGKIWAPVFKFLHDSESWNTRLTKVLCINRMTAINLQPDRQQTSFVDWLEENETDAFQSVRSFKELRSRLDREPFHKYLLFTDVISTDAESGGCLYLLECALSYFAMPLFLVGRCIHVLFPIVMYFMNIAFMGFANVLVLHHVLTLSYLLLLTVTCLASIEVFRFTYCLFHIGYFISQPHLIQQNTFLKIEGYYNRIVILPVLKELLLKRFGNDVPGIIIAYMGFNRLQGINEPYEQSMRNKNE